MRNVTSGRAQTVGEVRIPRCTLGYEIPPQRHKGSKRDSKVLTYLKLTQYRLGLLINFNVEVLRSGIYRIING